MMRRAVAGFLALNLAWSPAFAGQSGVTLWSGVKAGMSAQEVLRALPGSTMSADGKTISGPETQVAGQPMRSFVEFVGGKAAKVSLTGSGIASNVRAGLAAKYGRPVQPRSCSSLPPSLTVCVDGWTSSNGVKVTLTQMTGPKGIGLMIDYQVLDTVNL